jgi:hypothetical protein
MKNKIAFSKPRLLLGWAFLILLLISVVSLFLIVVNVFPENLQ